MQAKRPGCVLCALLLLVSSALGVEATKVARSRQKVTPVEKVIELIKKLSAQIEEEGKTEAAQYDKYACFCKEQADEKQYQIEKSEKKIEKLAAQINALEAEIAQLTKDIASLEERISELEGEIKTTVEIRDKEHAAYLVEAADMDGAIGALVGAIKALKDSKAQLKDAKLDFVQLRSLLAMAAAHSATVHERVLTRLAEPGSPHAYEYQSNDIIATLQGLLVDFKQMKKELDEAEFALKAASDKKKLNLENEKKFALQDKAEKEEVLGAKEKDLHAKQEDKENETKMKEADEAFRAELTEACETKAKEFDQRSQMRSEELTAIAQALEALETGVKPNWGANKKLVGLAQVPKEKGHWVWVQDADAQHAKAAPFLLQVHETSTLASATSRVLKLLEGAAARLRSPQLATLALRVKAKVAEDHFVKVRGIIKDLMAKLEADAQAEADQKAFCDTEMKAAITSRDEAQASIESLTADITQAEAEKAATEAEIRALEEAIAELQKALLEATELRSKERAENEKTIADATSGKEAVKFALQVLQEFYEGAVALQVGYVPPNSDREGKTVGDLAPEVFAGKYSGRQDASKGILGMLEVILSDFERTIETVTEEEAEAQAEFEQFEADTKADIEAKDTEKSEKEAKVAELADKIAELTDELKDAEEKKASALAELEKLKPMCVEAEETYAERVAKREAEIEALKQAMEILENWQA